MARKLAAGEHEVAEGIVMTAREWAATLLTRVAEDASVGMFPTDVSAFDFGRALGRVMSNCPEEDAFKELWRGYFHYENVRGSGRDV